MLYYSSGSTYIFQLLLKQVAIIMASMPSRMWSAYYIEYLVALVSKCLPCGVIFNKDSRKSIKDFPHRELATVKQPLLKFQAYEYFAHVSCRAGTRLYVYIYNLSKWGHPSCQNISQNQQQIRSSK